MGDDKTRQYLEREGAEKVRLTLLAGNLEGEFVDPATTWLAELDEAERVRNKAAQASTKWAAWIAAIAAIIAVVVTVLAWLYPQH